jgi:hypothetical protein
VIHRSSATWIATSLLLGAYAPLNGVEASRNRSIVGAWTAEVKILDCASGQATPAPAAGVFELIHSRSTVGSLSRAWRADRDAN